MYTTYVNLAHDEVSLTRVSNLHVEVTHVNTTFSFCIIMQQNCSRLMTDCRIYRIDKYIVRIMKIKTKKHIKKRKSLLLSTVFTPELRGPDYRVGKSICCSSIFLWTGSSEMAINVKPVRFSWVS